MSRLVSRLLLVLLGLIAATVIVVPVLMNTGYERMGDVGGIWGLRLGWRLAGELNQLRSWGALVPALAVIAIAEVRGFRSVLYYLAGGALALLLAPVMLRLMQTGAFTLPEFEVARVLAVAGMAGGYVYWYIAGHNA